ncbi:hypothetical protein H310_13884 [Aphanomyces invadans]|uniref:Uncharacterized protein n=1 Tax=Aphanomyces invadans TaxID=157072 RepID=A0A024TE55_9STRA|nr:hypothetical protein H310_13884 [Aphanomyces invadans]ETV91637.1 hypothetical protein H310_13884 [Aphanomyces invadans]|eukprot:XP_008879756.1 hypothetical protein H310_13884 [Aphanomyces invadans]
MLRLQVLLFTRLTAKDSTNGLLQSRGLSRAVGSRQNQVSSSKGWTCVTGRDSRRFVDPSPRQLCVEGAWYIRGTHSFSINFRHRCHGTVGDTSTTSRGDAFDPTRASRSLYERLVAFHMAKRVPSIDKVTMLHTRRDGRCSR